MIILHIVIITLSKYGFEDVVKRAKGMEIPDSLRYEIENITFKSSTPQLELNFIYPSYYENNEYIYYPGDSLPLQYREETKLSKVSIGIKNFVPFFNINFTTEVEKIRRITNIYEPEDRIYLNSYIDIERTFLKRDEERIKLITRKIKREKAYLLYLKSKRRRISKAKELFLSILIDRERIKMKERIVKVIDTLLRIIEKRKEDYNLIDNMEFIGLKLKRAEITKTLENLRIENELKVKELKELLMLKDSVLFHDNLRIMESPVESNGDEILDFKIDSLNLLLDKYNYERELSDSRPGFTVNFMIGYWGIGESGEEVMNRFSMKNLGYGLSFNLPLRLWNADDALYLSKRLYEKELRERRNHYKRYMEEMKKKSEEAYLRGMEIEELGKNIKQEIELTERLVREGGMSIKIMIERLEQIDSYWDRYLKLIEECNKTIFEFNEKIGEK